MRSCISSLKMDFNVSNSLLDLFFHLEYQQILLPVWFRKINANYQHHKAWLSGFYGGGILSILE